MRPTHALPAADSIDVLVRVISRASRDEVGAERAGRLVVRTQSAPVDDHANESVCRAIAHHFGVTRQHVELLSGQRSRDKTLRVNRVARIHQISKLPVAAAPSR